MFEKFDKTVSLEERKIHYAERVNDFLTEIMPYRNTLTKFPKLPALNTKFYAANMEFVVYCNDGSDVISEQLLKAYQVIMTYRFPMRMNPLNVLKVEALSEYEKELLYRDEVDFILMKIQEINPAFCIHTIPKSLYQLLFFIANEKEQDTAFNNNSSFFTSTKRTHYISCVNEEKEADDLNSVANINRPAFGFAFGKTTVFTNPNHIEDYAQHCLSYLACPIVTQEWYNTNLFVLDLLFRRGLLGNDFDTYRLKDVTIWALDTIGHSTSFSMKRNERKDRS